MNLTELKALTASLPRITMEAAAAIVRVPGTTAVGDLVIALRRNQGWTAGTVIALTDEPGKAIGVEYDEAVGEHSCDGRGKDRFCSWIHPDHVFDVRQAESLLKDVTAAQVAKRAADKKLVLVTDKAGHRSLQPVE